MLVHRSDKRRRLGHTVDQAVAADGLDGSDDAAGGVAQQDPLGRIMDIQLRAGGVHPRHGEIHLLRQSQGWLPVPVRRRSPQDQSAMDALQNFR